MYNFKANGFIYRKSSIKAPGGAYLISRPKRGGLNREGGGSYIFSTKFTIIFQTSLLHQ